MFIFQVRESTHSSLKGNVLTRILELENLLALVNKLSLSLKKNAKKWAKSVRIDDLLFKRKCSPKQIIE